MAHVVLVTRAKEDGMLVDNVGIVGKLSERVRVQTSEESYGLVIEKSEFLTQLDNLGMVLPRAEEFIRDGLMDEDVTARAAVLGWRPPE